MEFTEEVMDDNEMDKFTSLMKSNTVVECKILKLKSFINSLKTELIDLSRQIEQEKSLNSRLSSEVDVQQSMELQLRIRIGNLNKSKHFAAKLCNDLYEQVNLEKQRCDTAKQSQEASIKAQLAKWEDYQKLYRKFPMVKEVENAEAQLKMVEIQKKKTEHELESLKEKIKTREALQEQRLQILKDKVEASKSLNEELKSKMEMLKSKKAEELELIDDLKRKRDDILSKMTKDTDSLFPNMKRPGDLEESNTTVDVTRPNSQPSTGPCVVNLELPELPQLQLLQTAAPSRKMRRLDMVDTTLQRPDFMNLAKLKSNSRPQSASSRTTNKHRILSTISSNSIQRNNVSENHSHNRSTGRFNQVMNVSQSSGKENQHSSQQTGYQYQLVKPLTIQSEGDSQNNLEIVGSNVENDNEDLNGSQSQSQEVVENTNDNQTQKHPVDTLTQTPVSSKHDNNPVDDGYYSQSQNAMTSQASQLSGRSCRSDESSPKLEHPVRHNQLNPNTDDRRNEMSTPSSGVSSASSRGLIETRSKYFMSGPGENHSLLPVASTSKTSDVFKVPLPRSSNMEKAQGMSVYNKPDNFYNNEDQLKSNNDFHVMQNRQESNERDSEQAEYFNPQRNDRPISSWSKSPSPPLEPNMSSPPDMRFDNSYLNLLSPPERDRQISIGDRPGPSTQPSGGERPLMMFGAPQTKTNDDSNGFSFTSKMPSTSSFFSMFK